MDLLPGSSQSRVPSSSGSVQRTRRRSHETKRARGEISCAECRRLKMKCDKKVPCATCIRRGCANICPNGSLSGGNGSRLILANTEVLHRKIDQLSERVRLLEDALAVLQSTVSKDLHPLLTKELKRIKFWPEPEDEISNKNKSGSGSGDGAKNDKGIAETISAMGTLTVGDDGEAKYFGQSAGTELLLYAKADIDDFRTNITTNTAIPQTDELNPMPWPDASLTCGGSRPSAAEGHLVLTTLESSLPPITRAWALCESYYTHASWFFCPVRRGELINDIMSPIYSALSLTLSPSPSSLAPKSPSPAPGTIANLYPHKLAVLYLIFALGSLADLTQPPYNAEAHQYFLLARNALMLRSITDSPAVETVQAMSLLSAYHTMSGRKSTAESAWSVMSTCVRLAQSMGLHRDSAGWGLDAKTIQKRRHVWWEIYTADVTLSLKMGRPPSTALAYVDCEFPDDEEESVDENGETECGFWAWKHSVAKNILGTILEATLQARPATYQTILDLDRKVRQTGLLPKSFSMILPPGHEDYRKPEVCLQAWIMTQFRLNSMLYIHRSYFAQALLHHGADALSSPYAPSFLASYRCASLLIKSHIHYFDRCRDLFLRVGGFWTHAFTASVIMGLVVTKMPKSSMATNAFAELNLAVDLFEKGASVNLRAQRSLHVLQKLRMKAYRAYAESRMVKGVSSKDTNGDGESSDKDGEADLSLFGGHTRVLPSKFISQRWASRSRVKSVGVGVSSSTSDSPSDGTESQASPSSTTGNARQEEDAYPPGTSATAEYQTPAGGEVHPALMQYLSEFASTEANGESDASTTDPLADFSIMMDWSATGFDSQFPEFYAPQTFDGDSSVMLPQSDVQGPLQSASFALAQDPAVQLPSHDYEYYNSDTTATSSFTNAQDNGFFGYDTSYLTPSTPSTLSQSNMYDPDAQELLEVGLPSGDQDMDSRMMDRTWMELMKGSGLLDDIAEEGMGQEQENPC